MTDTIALIPARGGSKGIPRKNLYPLAGKPLVVHSIEQALAAQRVDRVYVSTDGEEIAAVSRAAGAEVIRRPAELASDTASSEAALEHALALITTRCDAPGLVVFLQATSPCRLPGDIDGAVKELENQQADSCFSACAEHFTGRWRIDESGAAQPVNFALAQRPRRQDYPVEYLENGSIYVFRPDVLATYGARLGGRIAVYAMPPLRSFQVDTPDDVIMLEQLMAVTARDNAQ